MFVLRGVLFGVARAIYDMIGSVSILCETYTYENRFYFSEVK